MTAEFLTRAYKKIIILLLTSAFIIRLVVGLVGYKNEVWKEFADDLARERYANTILDKGLVFNMKDYKSAESIFAPGVPLIIAFSKYFFGNGWLPLFVINALIGTITTMVIYLIASFYFNKSVSLLVSFWVAIYPNFIRYTTSAGNEPWIVFLFALTLFLLVKTIKNPRINLYVLLYALSFTLMFHFDERYITYYLLFPLFLFLGKDCFRLKSIKIGFFIFFTSLFSMPWLIRNYLVYDDIVIISCRTTNITNPIFNHRKELLFFDHTPNNLYLNNKQIDSVQKGLLSKFPDGRSIRQAQIQAMKSGNIPHSFSTGSKILSRLYFLWMPFKFRDNYRIDGYNFKQAWSIKHNLISILSYGILLPFALFGMIILFKNKRWEEFFLFASILIYHTVIHVAFIPYTRDRYRHPVDFIIIILGCYGIVKSYNYLLSLRKKRRLKINAEEGTSNYP